MPLFWFKVLNEIKIYPHEKYLKYDFTYSRVRIRSDKNVLLKIKIKIKKPDNYYIDIFLIEFEYSKEKLYKWRLLIFYNIFFWETCIKRWRKNGFTKSS